MQLTPYKELIGLSKDEVNQRNAPAKIKTQQRKAELKIAELEEKIVSLEESVVNLCSQKELNFDAIVDKQDELALAERRKNQFETALTQLFPKGK